MSRLQAGLAATIAAFVCLSASTQATAPRAAGPGAKAPRFVAGELVVGFAPGASRAERAGVARGLGARVAERIPISDAALLELPAGLGVGRAAALAESRGAVAYAEPNLIYRVSDTSPNDPGFGQLWGLHNTGQTVNGSAGIADADIDAPAAWDTTTGNRARPLAVIDTGIAAAHPDLAGNLWTNPGEVAGNDLDDDGNGLVDDLAGWDFVEDDDSPDDAHSHGTHVAGTAGAIGNNGIGITGVNWNVSLMALKAGGADGSLPVASIAAAIGYAREQGAPVVNASFGGPASFTVASAIGNSPGVLFVAAAGNDGRNLDGSAGEFPCEVNLDNVICVAATTQSDTLAWFSNFGPGSVDLAAPGTNTLSTSPDFSPPLFNDDFELPGFGLPIGGTWATGGTNDSWARTQDEFGGPFSIADSPGGSYLNNTNSFAKPSNSFDLSGETGCSLGFDVAHSLAGGDGLLAEATTDPVAGPWLTLATVVGSDTGGRRVTADLPDSLSAPGIHLRFRLITNGSGTADGVHIDNVTLRCQKALTYSFKNGTSMATPHVAGAAALILAAHPGYTVGNLRAALLHNVDPLGSLACKVVTGGRLNLAAAIDPNAPLSPAPSNGCPSPAAQPAPITQTTGDTTTIEAPHCAGKQATIVGTGVKDEIRGTKRADVIVALGGADTVRGRGGNDRICGGNGADRLYGGPGKDRLQGGKGRDGLFGGKGPDRLKGGPGKDRVKQ